MTGHQETLWRRWSEYQRFAYDFARRVSGHDADAEDLAQEALIELVEKRRPPAVALKAFLGRHIVLGARMLKRSALTRLRHERAAARAPELRERPDAGPDVEAVLALLDAEERHAVELRFLHDLPYAEVAHVLGIAEPAARMRVHRALKTLRERLGERAPALVAGLALFAPPSHFAQATRAATLAGGALLMGKTIKIALVAVLAIVLLAGGAYVVGTRTGHAPAPERAERHAAAVPPAPATSGEPTAKKKEPAPTVTTRGAPPAGKAVLEGTVRFVDGTPLRGESVSLWGGRPVLAETDEGGAFELHGGWGGERDLCLAGPNRFRVVIAKPVLREDETTTIDVRLRPGLSWKGRVLFADDRTPATNARVYLRRVDAQADGIAQASWAHVHADAEGRFEFRHLLPGRYWLSITRWRAEAVAMDVELRGHGERELLLKRSRPWTIRFANLPAAWRGAAVSLGVSAIDSKALVLPVYTGVLDANGEVRIDTPPPGRYIVATYQGRSPLPRMHRTVTLGEGAPEPLVFELPGLGRIEGTLVLPGGNPAVNTSVSLERSGLGAKTDDAGRFVIENVPAGEDELRFHFGRARLLVENPEPVATYRLVGTGSIRGRLIAKTGFRTVTLRNADGPVAEADADGDGVFVIPHLEPGAYTLTAWGSNLSRERRDVHVTTGEIDVGDIEVRQAVIVPIIVTAPEGTKLGGHHRGGAWGAHGGISVSWVLDEKGRGHVTLPPGTWRVTFQLHDLPSQVAEIEVKQAKNEPVRLEFAR